MAINSESYTQDNGKSTLEPFADEGIIRSIWWSQEKLNTLIESIREHGVQSKYDWQKLRSVCHVISPAKRAFLLKSFQDMGFSDASLIYLFGNTAKPREIRESTWQAIR